jgi:hypothetical protein
MKLKGTDGNYIPKSVLQQYIKISSATSARAEHPSADAEAPIGWKVLSGGAQVLYPFGEDGINIYGNLLTDSRNCGSAWHAASKDHVYYSPAMITAYVISINPNIPAFGTLDIMDKSGIIPTSPCVPSSFTINSDPGYCVVGVGAYTIYNGYGRMLVKLGMYTDNTGIVAQDKDHLYADSGYLGASLTEIKRLN